MNDIDITLYFNEYRLNALSDALGKQTAYTVEDKLVETFDMLYQEYVPDDQRASIEERIEQEAAAEQARLEAKRRFAVYHVRENGEDWHFTSDHFRTVMQAACRYRLYSRGELSAEPETFAGAFMETKPLALTDFDEICADINSDQRVTARFDFDLDEGRVSVCDSSDNAWRTYSLHDFSVAAYKAYRSDYQSTDCRREIFSSALCGKEIETNRSVDEMEAPSMQM